MKIEATRVTEDFIRNHRTRNYNPAEWDRTIDFYLKHGKEIEFYSVEPNDLIQYHRFYIRFINTDGIRMMNQVTYHSMMSNSGFLEVIIQTHHEGLTLVDLYNEAQTEGFKPDMLEKTKQIMDSPTVFIEQRQITIGDQTGAIKGDKAGREWMAATSKYNTFTQGL